MHILRYLSISNIALLNEFDKKHALLSNSKLLRQERKDKRKERQVCSDK